PKRPNLPLAERGGTSDDFFTWQDLPRSVAIVGAGYIAVELAGVLRALGSEVTLVMRGDGPLRSFDASVTAVLAEEMHESGIQLVRGCEVRGLVAAAGGLELEQARGERLGAFERVVWAIGRTPNSQGIGLEELGVMRDAKGHVEVDEWQATNVPDLYAVGDVPGRVPLTPVAIAAGRRLSDRLFGGQTGAKLDYEDIPSVVFSHPPLGTVGLSEVVARQRYGADNVRIYQTRFTDMYSGLLDRRPPTVMKLVTVLP